MGVYTVRQQERQFTRDDVVQDVCSESLIAQTFRETLVSTERVAVPHDSISPTLTCTYNANPE